MSRQIGLEELLKSGTMPPRAALDLAAALCDAMAGQPAIGPDALQIARISFDSQGVLKLDRRGARAATEQDTRMGLGLVLFRVLVGNDWQTAPGRRKLQEEELGNQLAFWPDGKSVSELVLELLTASGGFSGVRSRVEALRQRAAGPALGDWREDAIISLSEGAIERDQPQRVMSVDELTANIPVGMLAAAKEANAPAAPGPVLKVTPAPSSRQDDLPTEVQKPVSAGMSTGAKVAIPAVTLVLVGGGSVAVFVIALLAGLWLMG